MAMTDRDNMNEHLDMLRQLRHSYANNDEEVENVRRIAQLHEELAQLCQEDEQEITGIIRGAIKTYTLQLRARSQCVVASGTATC